MKDDVSEMELLTGWGGAAAAAEGRGRPEAEGVLDCPFVKEVRGEWDSELRRGNNMAEPPISFEKDIYKNSNWWFHGMMLNIQCKLPTDVNEQ